MSGRIAKGFSGVQCKRIERLSKKILVKYLEDFLKKTSEIFEEIRNTN